MVNLYLEQIPSLEKVFLSDKPAPSDYQRASILKGEAFAYQIAYYCEGASKTDAALRVESALSDRISVRLVGNVPSELPAYPDSHDAHYLKTEPGLFPDALYEPALPGLVEVTPFCRALWIELPACEDIEAGIYPITVHLESGEHNAHVSKTFRLEVINASLPPQKLIYTQWFHADCIATYYNLEVFSEAHWDMLEKFIAMAANHGINMLLTPIFTPPLDTRVGGERPTVQLVEVTKDGGSYAFGFERLRRWVSLCRKHGIVYFEMSHLFTQWGAAHAPKIVALENGVQKRIFGWDTQADSPEYKRFLSLFLPQLTAFLKEEGIDGHTYFHISDEPSEEHQQTYAASRAAVEEFLKDFVIFDALSNYSFYEKGLVTTPVCATDHIEPFLAHNVPQLWVYNCCGQSVDVGNRFMAMPSYRNRILGLQLYKYAIRGFLHWGYNFYYSQFSRYPVNPFLVTDAGGAFPSGDAFSVYPGAAGPIESIRLKVFAQGLADLRALELLETHMPREEIVAMLDAEAPLTFRQYPRSADFILGFREKVNQLLKERIGSGG